MTIRLAYPDGTTRSFDMMGVLNFIDRLAAAHAQEPLLRFTEPDADGELARAAVLDQIFHLANLLAYTLFYLNRQAPETHSAEHEHIGYALRLLRALAESQGQDLWPELDLH